jgi:hypothetical protein
MDQRTLSLPVSTSTALAAWTALALGALLLMLPLSGTTLPPIVDYPNHVAKAHIMANWDHFNSFDGVYAAGSLLIPNVLTDIIQMGLTMVVGPFEAGRILLALILLMSLGGAFALHAVATGKISPWPVLVVPFLYNEMFFWGFLNYLLGLALLLWGCACWLFFERRNRAWQLFSCSAFALAIFFAHLVAFGLFAIAIALFELRQVAIFRKRAGKEPDLKVGPGGLFRASRNRPGMWPAFARLASSAACFVPALAVFVLGSPTRGLTLLHLDFSFDPFDKLSPFTRMLASGHVLIDTVVLLAVVVMLGLLLARRQLSAAPALALVAVAFAVLTLVLPHSAMGSFYLDDRVPIAAALLGVVAIHPRGADARNTVVLSMLVSLIILRTSIIAADWRESDRYYRSLLQAFEGLPENGLMVAVSGTKWEDKVGWLETRTVYPPHEHIAHYATVISGIPVLHLFAKSGRNPVIMEPHSSVLRDLTTGPIRSAADGNALARLVEKVRKAATADPVFSKRALFIAAFRVPCSEWPARIHAKKVFCRPDFSLMELSKPPPERWPSPFLS